MLPRLFLLAVCAISLTAAQVMVTPSVDRVLNVGDSFSYKCTNGDTSLSSVFAEWTDEDGTVIPTSSAGSNSRLYTTETIENELKITRLQFSDVELTESGRYTCALGSDREERTIIVAIPPTFPRREAEASQRLLVDETSSVTCTINASPFPQVLWKFNTAIIDSVSGKYAMTTSAVSDPQKPGMEYARRATLEVRNVVTADSGSYTCEASVDETGGFDAFDIEVIVQVPPEWTVEPRDVAEVEGEDVQMQCRASGIPEPTYTWRYPGGQEIEPSDKYEFTNDGEFFTVKNLEPSDDRLYTCIASNDAINSSTSTAIEKTVEVTVLVLPTLNPQDNRTVEEERVFSMDCFITRSDATAVLSWRRGGVDERDELPIGTWNLDPRVIVERSDDNRTLTLRLNPTNYDHSGGWTCYATSNAGHVQVTHFLSIESDPFIDLSETDERVLSWPDNPVNMTCKYNGFPVPSIKWYVNDYILNETERINFLPAPKGMSVVQIIPVKSDFGPYSCQGRNERATTNFRIDLVEGTVPSEPLNLQLTDNTASMIRVRYDIPEDDGGFNIRRYVVAYRGDGGGEYLLREYENRTDVLLDGLSGNSRYYVKVAAINERGTGLYTPVDSTTTLPTTVATTVANVQPSVPDKPKIISKEESTYSDRYVLMWEAPVDDGGSDIKIYNIYYSSADGPSDTELNSRKFHYEASHTAREFTIMPLQENKYYTIKLEAVNEIGEGEQAGIVIKTTGGFIFPTTPKGRPTQNLGSLSTTVIVIIAVTSFVVLLILIDICCFCMNDCGVLMFFCVNCCGKSTPTSKEEIEMGDEEYGRSKTAPPGEGPPTYQPIENGKPEEPAHERMGTAEGDPLMTKDGDAGDDDTDTDSQYPERKFHPNDPNYIYGFPSRGATKC